MSHRSPVTVHSLPMELLYAVFDYLDLADVRSLLTICRRWRLICEHLLYRTPLLSSSAVMESFIHVVEHGRRYLLDCPRNLHIRGKANYSSMHPTPWILQAPLRLAALLPNVQSITLDHLENVDFPDHFWTDMEAFQRVTTLTISKSRFRRERDLWNMVFCFPHLTTLTLSYCRWDIKLEGKQAPSERWSRVLPLKSISLDFLCGSDEYRNVFRRLDQSFRHVRTLKLLHFPYHALPDVGQYLAKIASRGGSLESFTFGPSIEQVAHWRLIRSVSEALRQHRYLRALHLHISNMEDGPMNWVPRFLEDLQSARITTVALDFTLDLINARCLQPAWERTNYALCVQWQDSLQKVTLTHNPVGHFLSDADARYVLQSRLSYLDERKLLNVFIGEQYA